MWEAMGGCLFCFVFCQVCLGYAAGRGGGLGASFFLRMTCFILLFRPEFGDRRGHHTLREANAVRCFPKKILISLFLGRDDRLVIRKGYTSVYAGKKEVSSSPRIILRDFGYQTIVKAFRSNEKRHIPVRIKDMVRLNRGLEFRPRLRSLFEDASVGGEKTIMFRQKSVVH